MQDKREYCGMDFEERKRNGLSGSQLEVQQSRIRPNVLGLGEWAEGRCGCPVDALWDAHLLFKFRRGVERGRACCSALQ
jgi:hypothetical protein